PTGLSAGWHFVTVTSFEGCLIIDSIEIFEPAVLTVVLDSSFDASCNGFSDGTAYTTTSGGAPGYSYSWNTTPTAQTTDDASFLPFGPYTLIVTDNNGCTESVNANIGQPAVLAAVTGGIDAYCSLDQGTVWVSPTNGTYPYTYIWDSSAVVIGATDTLGGLYPGTYGVEVTDANGCKSTFTATVNAAPGGIANVSATTDVSCFGGSDGAATASTGGAFPGFTYVWEDAALTTVSTANPATGLPQGNYTVTVTDTLGCVMLANTVIGEPTALAFNFAPLDNFCPDSCVGSISAGASGGTFPYNFVWNDPSSQITSIATGLCDGTYTVTLTDSLGCNIIDSASVTNPPAMLLNPTSTTASCNQSDGSVNVTVTANGLAPFTYSWSDGISVVGSTSQINGLPAATYFATVTDSNGCSVTDTVTIPNLSGPVLTVDSVYTAQCFGGNDGYTEVSVTGGLFPYTYLWNDTTSQTTPSASNLTAGTYTVTVTDSNGCVASTAIVISQPTQLVLTAGGTDPSCFTYTDGSTWVNAFGGNPGYTYSWNDVGNQTTDTATALGDGTYTVTVIDSNLCFDTISVILIDPLLFSVNVTGNDVNCFGACDGDAMTALTNGIAPFAYLWDDPANQTTDSIFGLCDTTASVIVTDYMGCIANGAVLITQPPLLVVIEDTLAHVNVDCFGNATGSANLIISGGSGAYTFVWKLAGVTVPTATGQSANSLIAGSYLVTVTDATGCSENINIIITENNLLVANATPTDADCFGASTGSAFVSALGGTGAGTYTYLWTDITQQQTDTAFNLIANTYDVMVTDSNNCTVTVTGIVVGEPTQLVLNTTTVSSTCGANNGSATVNVGGGSFPYSYAWNTIPIQPTPTANSIVAGNYVIIVTDNNNCMDSTTANVADIGGPTATIPISTNVGCNGAGDGAAQSNVFGGIAPYSYVWNTGLIGDTLANVTG
ncbi:MAG: SprB repeat-containing protein, partial [Vicingaceae bacterium]